MFNLHLFWWIFSQLRGTFLDCPHAYLAWFPCPPWLMLKSPFPKEQSPFSEESSFKMGCFKQIIMVVPFFESSIVMFHDVSKKNSVFHAGPCKHHMFHRRIAQHFSVKAKRGHWAARSSGSWAAMAPADAPPSYWHATPNLRLWRRLEVRLDDLEIRRNSYDDGPWLGMQPSQSS